MRALCRDGLTLALGFLIAVSGTPANGAPPPPGRPVVAVEFSSPVPVDSATFRRHLPIQVGEAFEEMRLRESVRWLREKEIFSEIEPRVLSVERGVLVLFELHPMDFVVAVRVSGAAHIDEEEVLRRARIREDEPLSESREAAAVERVRSLYVDRGFPEAEVRIERIARQAGRIEAVLRIAEGDPVEIEDVDLFGIPAGERRAATEAAAVRTGAVFHESLRAEARERLVRHFRGKGYYEVDVRDRAEVVGRAAHLVFEVKLGPAFEIVLQGNREISRSELLGLANLERRPIVTDGTWRLLARRMEEEYRARGYRFAKVASSIESGDPKQVIFEIEEGPRVRVTDVRFEGNEALSAEALRGAMETGRPPPSLFGKAEPWLLEEGLAADRERIAELYRSHGYLEAEVRKIRREYHDDRRKVTLVIDIDEGAQTRVARVDVVGAEGLLTRPEAGLSVIEGAPLAPERLEEDRRRLVAQVAAAGRPDVSVEPRTGLEEVGDGVRRVSVRYHVRPGPEVRIGRIIVKQNYFTRDRVILQALPFRPGDPLDPASLLEAQRRIYRLGLFRSVSVQPSSVEGAVRDVIVRVVERPGGELQYGFGYNTRAGLRNFLQIGHRNVLGTGRPFTVSGELNLSPNDLTPDEYVIGTDAREPHVAGSDFDWRSNLVFQRSEREIDEFSIRRLSFSTGVEREFLPGFQWSTMIEFEDSRVFDVAPDVVLTGQDRGRLRTVSLNPILVYDGRDDAFAPTRGVFDTFRIRYGTPALGSEVHFVKVNAQHSQYVPLAEGWTGIYALRAGIAEPLGRSGTIPLRERFFLGGRTSVRGFDENGVGPRGEQGNPLGGDLTFGGNVEIRFPLVWGLGGAVFMDGGGLYLRDRAITLRDFRESAGLGLRYQTPIGAISLDYGFKLDRRRGESIGEVHFTIGNIF